MSYVEYVKQQKAKGAKVLTFEDWFLSSEELQSIQAKEFYRTMWNPLYEETDNKQFSYQEMIEFAIEYHHYLSKKS